MKYTGLPHLMWIFFQKSFRKNLLTTLNYNNKKSKNIAKLAKKQYKAIISELPTFEKGDSFIINILNASLLAAFLLSLPNKPTLEEVTKYYENSVTTKTFKIFCKISGKNKFSKKDKNTLINHSKKHFGDRNKYSWNYDYFEYEDNSGYEARFYKCGICVLMNELGLKEYTPALCHLDYVMSSLGGASNFVREYTLASGGPYCDCGYKKKQN